MFKFFGSNPYMYMIFKLNRPADSTPIGTRINTLKKNQRWISIVICILSAVMLLGVSDASAAVSNLGLVGYWSFNEGTGSYAGDSSGNRNQGTLVSGPTWVDGKRGKALNFDGVNDYVNAGDNTSLRITNSFTISAWVKTDQNTSGLNVVAKYNGTNGYFFGMTGTAPAGRMFGGVTTAGVITRRFTNTVLAVGRWYHIVTVYNASAATESMYVDGILDNGTQSGTPPSSVPSTAGMNFEIGSRTNGIELWDGLIDEVRIYNRALSAQEVLQLYNSSR